MITTTSLNEQMKAALAVFLASLVPTSRPPRTAETQHLLTVLDSTFDTPQDSGKLLQQCLALRKAPQMPSGELLYLKNALDDNAKRELIKQLFVFTEHISDQKTSATQAVSTFAIFLGFPNALVENVLNEARQTLLKRAPVQD